MGPLRSIGCTVSLILLNSHSHALWSAEIHLGVWATRGELTLQFLSSLFPKKNLSTSLGSTTDMAKFLLKKYFQVSAFVHACRATKVYWIDSGRLTSFILFTSLAPLSLVC